MKMDQIALILVVVAAIAWLVAFASGMISILPYGLLGLVPVLIVAGIIGRIIYQKKNNTEDNYYEENIDK